MYNKLYVRILKRSGDEDLNLPWELDNFLDGVRLSFDDYDRVTTVKAVFFFSMSAFGSSNYIHAYPVRSRIIILH